MKRLTVRHRVAAVGDGRHSMWPQGHADPCTGSPLRRLRPLSRPKRPNQLRPLEPTDGSGCGCGDGIGWRQRRRRGLQEPDLSGGRLQRQDEGHEGQHGRPVHRRRRREVRRTRSRRSRTPPASRSSTRARRSSRRRSRPRCRPARPADIIDFPQPGLLGTFFKQGKVVPVTKLVPESWLKENYKQSWLDMATMPGADGNPAMAGLWQRFNGKSLVWYPKKAFDDAGYKVPTTWEELQALQDMIVADGDTPWCVGIQSGAATGWPATDWTEDLMLRTTSPENYDKWVKGELKFDSPEVKKAIADVRRHLEQRQDGLRRQGQDRHHVLRRCAGADVREPAQVLAAPPGQLHHLLLPEGSRRRAWTMTCSTCRVWMRSTASRSWWPATSWRPPRSGLRPAPSCSSSPPAKA